MSDFLPSGEPFGRMRMDNVLIYHDGPVLFLCRNELDHAYLAVAVEGTSENETYLYVAMSEDRLHAALTGLVSLHDVFAEPETGRAFAVTVDNGGVVPTAALQMAAEAVPETWLPAEGEVLEERVPTAPVFSLDRLREMSSRQQRPLAALELDQPPTFRRTEFPLRHAGEILLEWQQTADVLAAEGAGKMSEAAALDSDQVLVELAAASVVFVVAPSTQDRLVAAPSQAMERIHRLLVALDGGESPFTDAVGGLSRRGVAHVRNFFATLTDAGSGVGLFGATPGGSSFESHVSREALSVGLEILRTRTPLPDTRESVVGHLIAIHHTLSTFGIQEERASGTRKRPRRFYGKIDPDLKDLVNGLPTGTAVTYRFEILTERDIAEFSDDPERPRHRLIAIESTGAVPLQGE